jgi:hypothetical protein
MLDFSQMIQSDHAGRRKVVADSILAELPRVLGKYGFADFDQSRFESDLREFVTGRLLAADAGKRDHLVLARASGH